MTSRAFRFENVDRAQQQLRKMPDRALKALEAGVYREGERIIADIKLRKLVPVDVGTLVNSGFVDRPIVALTRVSVEIGYGGAAKAYALIQHENEKFNHPKQGGPKFLERPVNEAEKGFGQRIAKTLERELKRGL